MGFTRTSIRTSITRDGAKRPSTGSARADVGRRSPSTGTPNRSRTSTKEWTSLRTSELEAASVRPIFDSGFLRRLVWAAGATPAVLLAWDAATGHLGVNGVNYAIRTTGMLALVFLVLALAV